MVSPHTSRSGNSVSSILLAHGLAELKRNVFLSHIKPQSSSFEFYLGLKDYVDKTSTPSQLVKLMREGAIKPEDIGDYCKNDVDFLDIFTNNKSNFSHEDMSTLLDFVIESDTKYEYLLFDIDDDINSDSAKLILQKSQIIILNVTTSFLELEEFNAMKESIAKLCKGKKVILLVSSYDSKVVKLKEIPKKLGLSTSAYPIRYNPWVSWSCNQGKLSYLFKQGKSKDPDVIDIYKDVTALTSTVSKAKVAVNKKVKGVFK